MDNSSRVVFNTAILYGKLIVGMVVGLITIRIVLDALGETDYGIYTLVAGVVGMLGILNGSMSHASMRFMSHSLGTGDRERTLKTFNTTLFLHFLIGAIVVVFIEIGGYFMFEYILNIPKERIFDAKVVFHLMVVTTFVSIISVPYDAVMNSHEDILALSLVDILGYVFKLGIAIYLTYSSLNLLILYGSLMLASQVLQRIIKQIYSKIKYDECKIRFREYLDRILAKEIMSFTGWNLFGSIASMTMTQVRGIMLNFFFGVGINAAEGISKKAGGQVNMIATSMTRALNPQLVKSEGSGDRKRMIYLTKVSTKFSVYLFALLAVPVLFEASFLLGLWLKEVPDYATIFVQLILIGLLIEKFSFEITNAIRAIGDIKALTITESSLIILNVPIAYILYKNNYPPQTFFFISIFISVLIFFSRLYYSKRIAGIKVGLFLREAVLPSILLVVPSILLSMLLTVFIQMGIARLILIFGLNAILLTALMWFLVLNNNENEILSNIFNRLLRSNE